MCHPTVGLLATQGQVGRACNGPSCADQGPHTTPIDPFKFHSDWEPNDPQWRPFGPRRTYLMEGPEPAWGGGCGWARSVTGPCQELCRCCLSWRPAGRRNRAPPAVVLFLLFLKGDPKARTLGTYESGLKRLVGVKDIVIPRMH